LILTSFSIEPESGLDNCVTLNAWTDYSSILHYLNIISSFRNVVKVGVYLSQHLLCLADDLDLVDDIDVNIFSKLSEIVKDAKEGLDPNTLSYWYSLIEFKAKEECPEKYKASIKVVQDPVLPMKFEIKSSRRAVRHVIYAIESCLAEMPLSTRLYFQKLQETIDHEAASFDMRKVTDSKDNYD